MSAGTSIEWCHYTFNPWWGCVRVSPGCEHCYAERDAKRYGHSVWGVEAPRRFFGDAHWHEPLKWARKRREGGDKHLVFCASMADVFEDDRRLDDERAKLWQTIRVTPALTWQLLTKRPHNFHLAPSEWVSKGWPPNVWLGVTAENQERADKRIPLLLQQQCAKRFVSYEPALGPVDFGRYYLADKCGGRYPFPQLDEEHRTKWIDLLDLVIVGGESGPGARPFDVAWARDTLRQCRAAHDATGKRPAFFMKQMGSRPFIERCRSCERWRRCACVYREDSPSAFHLADRKGGEMDEWLGALKDLRVRELPA
jgi:protein gp37